ncbi:MAG: O-antigen ligase family protein [Actinomycetota bacterium]
MYAARTEPTPGEPAPAGRSRGVAGLVRGAIAGVGPAALVLGVVAVVLAWWGFKEGAYFGTVFYPGAMVLLALLILLLAAAPLRARPRGFAGLALLALLLIAAWTLLSTLWTPSREGAVFDFGQAFLYAAVFLLGLWTCNLLGPRMLLGLAPVAAAGAAVGVATVVTIATETDASALLHGDATLFFPIGYRNANASFFLICVWPTLALAAESRAHWSLRALMVGSATMLLGLVVLCQSRGSLPAAAVALLVFIVLSPRRLRAGVHVGLAAVPVLAALPFLLDVFRHEVPGASAVPLLHDAAAAIAVASVASVVLAALAMRTLELRFDLGGARAARLSRVAAVVTIAAVVVAGKLIVAERGGPVHFVDQRVSEFEAGGLPDFSTQGTRFGVNVGSNRRDFWRVALDEGADDPVLGGGAGAFEIAYLQERDSPESPKDPHSLELLMFSELGLPGLLLLLLFLVAAAAAAMRSRRLGPTAAALGAGGVASGAQWLTQSSYDWFWHYPALTAAVMFMLGAVAAPSVLSPAQRFRRARIGAAAVTALVLAATVPLFFSERYFNRAYDEWQEKTLFASRDFDRAASLNPFAVAPLLYEGAIAAKLGDRERALDSLDEAVERQPDRFAAHFLLAQLYAGRNPAAARLEIEAALWLNPADPAARRLDRRIEGA